MAGLIVSVLCRPRFQIGISLFSSTYAAVVVGAGTGFAMLLTGVTTKRRRHVSKGGAATQNAVALAIAGATFIVVAIVGRCRDG